MNPESVGRSKIGMPPIVKPDGSTRTLSARAIPKNVILGPGGSGTVGVLVLVGVAVGVSVAVLVIVRVRDGVRVPDGVRV